MATNTNINFPQSEFLDPRTQRPAREWMLWLMSPNVIALNSNTALSVQSGGTGLSTTPTNGQLLIGNGTNYTLDTLTPGVGIAVTNASGSITVINTGVLSWSAGITGLTPATATTGNVTLSGLLNVASGGTGQSSYTNGQLLIGNTAGNTLGKSTLTAGSGIAITNGAASVTIASNKAYGSFYDTTTQSAAALTATAITLNSTDLSYNVAIGTPTSRIVIATAGIYNFQFSAQISNPSAAIDDVTIWLRQNGVNIANSAGLVGTPAKHGAINGHTIIGWNYLIQVAANDYLELYWTTDNGTTQILTYPASAVPPIHPQAPSMILTVQQV